MNWKLLRGLTDGEVAEVLSVGRRRRFARREVIWHEGDRADTLHFVESGQVAVQVVTSLGEVATGAVWGPGEVAGMIDGYAVEVFHPTSAFALQATETHAIRIDDFNDLRRRLPALDDALLEFFADKVEDLLSQLLDAHYVNVDARVVRRLAALSAIYDRGESEVEIPLTQEDIAALVGATRPSVNRVLKKEETRGTIRLGRASITIIDKDALTSRPR